MKDLIFATKQTIRKLLQPVHIHINYVHVQVPNLLEGQDAQNTTLTSPHYTSTRVHWKLICYNLG